MRAVTDSQQEGTPMSLLDSLQKKKPQGSNGNTLEKLLSVSWEAFEAWITQTIGGGFVWKIRPRDAPENRQMVIESIFSAMKRNGGTFPKSDAFLERDDD